MDIFVIISLAFTVWMCIDCIQRKEHFIWIVIMLLLSPVGAIGAIIYFFAVKNKEKTQGQRQGNLFPLPSKPKEVESEETMHLKELIKQHHKAFHYEKLGDVYLDRKQYELATPQFREAVNKDPEMNGARYGLGKSLHGSGKYTEAAEVLEELIAIDKKYDYGNAIFGLAECYRLAGMETKAMETYKEVINSFAFFKAYYHYGRLLDKTGEKQEAIDQMKSLIGSSKDLPDYKLEKERYWIDEAYKFLRKNGIELA